MGNIPAVQVQASMQGSCAMAAARGCCRCPTEPHTIDKTKKIKEFLLENQHFQDVHFFGFKKLHGDIQDASKRLQERPMTSQDASKTTQDRLKNAPKMLQDTIIFAQEPPKTPPKTYSGARTCPDPPHPRYPQPLRKPPQDLSQKPPKILINWRGGT